MTVRVLASRHLVLRSERLWHSGNLQLRPTTQEILFRLLGNAGHAQVKVFGCMTIRQLIEAEGDTRATQARRKGGAASSPSEAALFALSESRIIMSSEAGAIEGLAVARSRLDHHPHRLSVTQRRPSGTHNEDR